MEKRILMASGQRAIDSAVKGFENYEVVASVEYRKDILGAMTEYNPEILFVGEGLGGSESLVGELLNISKHFPDTRIIYLAGFVDMKDEDKIAALGVLVMSGIFDIIHDKKVSATMIEHLLDNPKTYEQMAYLTNKVKDIGNKNAPVEFELPEKNLDEDGDVYSNMAVVSSIKPGTGKSFLSTNIATAIAAYGETNERGERPRVALIEADLQNLSVGTLLQIEDEKHNLKTVMDKIATIVTKDGNLIGNIQQTEDVNKYIKNCFSPYYKVKNLKALTGSQLTFNEMEDISQHYYAYLIEAISKEFDVIIVDSNSSLTHVTTYPLLHMSKSCYYVLNLDFNNVRNNIRYRGMFKEMGIEHKVKYILNEDINESNNFGKGDGVDEELMYTAEHVKDAGFQLEAQVPMLSKNVFLNKLYSGEPVVLDRGPYTLRARYEILKVANQIYPIKDFDKIEEEIENNSQKKKKKRFF